MMHWEASLATKKKKLIKTLHAPHPVAWDPPVTLRESWKKEVKKKERDYSFFPAKISGKGN